MTNEQDRTKEEYRDLWHIAMYDVGRLRGLLEARESQLAEQTEAATRYLARINRLEAALDFYADPSNWASPSKGFALQYDPEPSPIQRAGRHLPARAALSQGES